MSRHVLKATLKYKSFINMHTAPAVHPLLLLMQIGPPSLISFQGSTLPLHAVDTTRTYGGVLEIRNITRSEGGNYTCIIAKDGVTASTSVMVSVIEGIA